ncbi:hypothetical protein [Deinococcus aquaticus]|uniref:hypothetical protein n=1 Tax=Deinococcus aquaticus TaxID=328692 RepID=UPI00360B9B96
MGILTPSTSTVRQTERNSAGTLTSVPQASALITGDLLALTASYLISLPLLSVLGVQGINLHSLLVWGGVWLLWRAYQGLYPGYGRSPRPNSGFT